MLLNFIKISSFDRNINFTKFGNPIGICHNLSKFDQLRFIIIFYQLIQ